MEDHDHHVLGLPSGLEGGVPARSFGIYAAYAGPVTSGVNRGTRGSPTPRSAPPPVYRTGVPRRSPQAAQRATVWSRPGCLRVGTPVANRRRTELEGLIGVFVNTLALRIDPSGRPSVAQLVGWVRKVALDALKHQDVPFEHVVELVNPPHTPLFQNMFARQSNEEADLRLPGIGCPHWRRCPPPPNSIGRCSCVKRAGAW
uniref:Condensation domain-containing protein n=1 Tax=Streptomyces sp. NBC_00003 TaxID=2903608 RepID=A0AAU2VH62_9ACTN